LLHNDTNVTVSAEKESKSSKERRKFQNVSQNGKKPDAMITMTLNKHDFEIMFLECSRLVSDRNKYNADKVKLWRESHDGFCYTTSACKPDKNHFAISNIQVHGWFLIIIFIYYRKISNKMFLINL